MARSDRDTTPLELVGLTPLMERTIGRAEIVVGLIDGPVALEHPQLVGGNIRQLPGASGRQAASAADRHGTFVAGILSGKRGGEAPAICPGCTLLVHPIFGATMPPHGAMVSATSIDLAAAMIACVDAGARVINLSLGFSHPAATDHDALRQALDYGRQRRVIVVVAAGNQGSVGSSLITRHPAVIPIVAYDRRARPLNHSNLGGTIGRRGMGAPGDAITSLGLGNEPQTLTGTSVATPFVTGAIALLWSEFPSATTTELRFAVTQAVGPRRTSITPPLLDAWASYQALKLGQLRQGR